MITINYILTSDLTLEVLPSEVIYIQILANLSTCILGTKIDTNGAYKVESTLNSTEFLETSTYEASTWENIRVSGVEYSELTFDIPSVIFNSPNVLRIENISTGSETLQINLRGNR